MKTRVQTGVAEGDLLRDKKEGRVHACLCQAEHSTHMHTLALERTNSSRLRSVTKAWLKGVRVSGIRREGGGGSRPAVNARRSSAEHLIIIVKRRCAHIQFVLPWRHTAIIIIPSVPPSRRPPVVEVLVVVMVVVLCFACNRTTAVITTRLHGGYAEPTKTPHELPHPRNERTERARNF
jgi:hypothetical protein